MNHRNCANLSPPCLCCPAAGVVALLVSLLTAGALALHLTYSGSAAAASWSLAGLRLSSRQHTAAQQHQQRQAALSCGDGGNLTQLLCDPASAHSAADRSSGGGGATGGRPPNIATGLPASWAAGHIAHDFRHWRHTGIRKKALDKLASDVDVHKVGKPPNQTKLQYLWSCSGTTYTCALLNPFNHERHLAARPVAAPPAEVVRLHLLHS